MNEQVQAKQCAKCTQNNAKETIVMNNAKKQCIIITIMITIMIMIIISMCLGGKLVTKRSAPHLLIIDPRLFPHGAWRPRRILHLHRQISYH